MENCRLSLSEARRIALTAQGFDQYRPAGRVDVRHLRRVILRLGLLQIDFVNVLVPAHYMVLFSRLGPYPKSCLEDLVYRRREFMEQWAHEASIVPIQSWPLLAYRRQHHRVRPWGFEAFLKANPEYVAWVVDQVRLRGPLSAADLPELDGEPRHISDKWGWSLAVKRQVFEAHFGFGRLAIANRKTNFARVYDLTERVVPKEFIGERIDRREAQRRLLLQAARAHGVATAGDLADYYRMSLKETHPRLKELVEREDLLLAEVEGWGQPAFLHPQAQLPERINTAALLSPFDPLVWTRARVARLFGFDYRLEIFVPARRRRWGYYVLPFLLGDRLVARVDLKADRKQKILRVQASHVESRADLAEVATALSAELLQLRTWLDLRSVAVRRKGSLASALASQIDA